MIQIVSVCLCVQQDFDILASHYPLNTQMVYILSLGVVKEYRRHGVGVLLFIFMSVLMHEAELVVK